MKRKILYIFLGFCVLAIVPFGLLGLALFKYKQSREKNEKPDSIEQ